MASSNRTLYRMFLFGRDTLFEHGPGVFIIIDQKVLQFCWWFITGDVPHLLHFGHKIRVLYRLFYCRDQNFLGFLRYSNWGKETCPGRRNTTLVTQLLQGRDVWKIRYAWSSKIPLTFPDLYWVSKTDKGKEADSTCPPRRAVVFAPTPLKGIMVISTLHNCFDHLPLNVIDSTRTHRAITNLLGILLGIINELGEIFPRCLGPQAVTVGKKVWKPKGSRSLTGS